MCHIVHAVLSLMVTEKQEVLHSPPCPEHNMASVGCAQCPIHLRYCVFMMNLVGHDPTVGERNLCSACDYIFLISILK